METHVYMDGYCVDNRDVSMEPRFFNHGDPPRFLRVSSWASGGDFEHLLASLQKLCDFGAASRVAPRVAAVSRCEHLPGFWPVLRCSKMASYAIRRFCYGLRRYSYTDSSRTVGLLLLCGMVSVVSIPGTSVACSYGTLFGRHCPMVADADPSEPSALRFDIRRAVTMVI